MESKYSYMLLSRLQMDCDYYLGNGSGCHRHLWAGNPEDQIKEMHRIYDLLPEKPEWLTLEQIQAYEEKMLTEQTENSHDERTT